MAMAFADRRARRPSGPSTIDGADAVAISYPDFFETLERWSVRRLARDAVSER